MISIQPGFETLEPKRGKSLPEAVLHSFVIERSRMSTTLVPERQISKGGCLSCLRHAAVNFVDRSLALG
jgi:hypothetical protein